MASALASSELPIPRAVPLHQRRPVDLKAWHAECGEKTEESWPCRCVCGAKNVPAGIRRMALRRTRF
jgi:hypothetical protein